MMGFLDRFCDHKTGQLTGETRPDGLRNSGHGVVAELDSVGFAMHDGSDCPAIAPFGFCSHRQQNLLFFQLLKTCGRPASYLRLGFDDRITPTCNPPWQRDVPVETRRSGINHQQRRWLLITKELSWAS